MAIQLPRVFTPPIRDLQEPDASWGHDFMWFCDRILDDPLSEWQGWLAVHALEVLTKEKALEFAMLEDDPSAEIAKVEYLYGSPEIRGGRAIPNGRLRFKKIVILISRQNGKTDFVKKLIKWAIFRKRLPEVLAAAQTLNKAIDLWNEIILELERHPKLRRLMGQVDRSKGAQAMWTRGKHRRYRPVGIDENAGRGDTVDLLYIDELRTQKDFTGVNALTSTTTVPDNGLILTTSNAGSAHSVVLRDFRKMAMKPIKDGTWADTRQALFEWSADPKADIDDRDGWRQANPDLGNGRITLATLAADRESVPEATFRTERLCQWVEELDEDFKPIVDINVWKSRSVTELVRLGHRALAIEVAPETGHKRMVSCGWSAQGAHFEVSPQGGALTDEETVAFVRRWCDANYRPLSARNLRVPQRDVTGPVAVVVDEKTEAASLIEPLRRAGIDVVPISYTSVRSSFKTFLARFQDGKLTNDGNELWEQALRTTKTREVSGGAEKLIDRFKGDPQVLVAAQLALWGLETFSPSRPKHGVEKNKVKIAYGAQSGAVQATPKARSGQRRRKPGDWM